MTMTREGRMEALVNAGIDTTAYVTVDNLATENVEDNDIMQNGYVRNTRLHRRWVMAQMFRGLNYNAYRGRRKGYDHNLEDNYSYTYQFTQALDEVKVLAELERADKDTFDERSIFFTKDVIVNMCQEYYDVFEEYVDNLEAVRNRKEIANFRGKNGSGLRKVKRYNVDSIDADLLKPMRRNIVSIKHAESYENLYRHFDRFVNRKMFELPERTEKIDSWLNAYKANGCYYTLQNLVKYHNCNFKKKGGAFMTQDESIKYLKSRYDALKSDGDKWMKLLTKTIKDNNFDFDARMREVYAE